MRRFLEDTVEAAKMVWRGDIPKRKEVLDEQPSTFFRPVQKTRHTQDRPYEFIPSSRFRSIIPPPNWQDDWLVLDIDEFNINSIPADRILLVLKSVSPQIAKAHWDFQQFCNNNWSYRVESPDGEISEEGTKATDAFMERIEENERGFDTVLDKLLSGAFLRGSYFPELIMHRRVPISLVAVDPVLARFAPAENRQRGQHDVLGQLKGGEFVPFDYPTIKYAPVNSMIGTPYGIPLIDSSIFSAVFMIGLLYDIRRVIAQQGYYRLDFSIDWEIMTEKIKRNNIKPGDVDAFIQSQIEKIRQYYDQLGPSDSIAHTSDIEVGDIGGSLNTEGMGSINTIIDWLNNQLTLACKTVPILMGISNSTSETHANRQWENFMATIRSCQRSLIEILNYIFTLALRYQGIQAKVYWQFQELSLTTAINQAIYQKQSLDNIEKALNMHIKGMNAEGKETIQEPVPLMTADEALAEWRQVRELR